MSGRLSVWILGDQLSDSHQAVVRAEKLLGGGKPAIVLIEPTPQAASTAFHPKRRVLAVSALRHYAELLRAGGYRVDYREALDPPAALRSHCQEYAPAGLLTMAASCYDDRRLQATLDDQLGIPVTVVPNTLFLAGRSDPFPDRDPTRPTVMASFYRAMRQQFRVLLDVDGAPVGGKWSFDAANRRPLRGNVVLPGIRTFEPDSLTARVMTEVEMSAAGPGSVSSFNLAVTRQQAVAALQDFIDHRLGDFGAYEDAMSARHATLFHSFLSPYLNLGLLQPLELVRAAEERYETGQAPLNSVEGFVRQVIGWREFIYWQYWRRMPGFASSNCWGASRSLPSFFWTADTDLSCLRHALRRAIQLGYNHHIERLMLMCNFCQLAGIAPMQVHDWFMSHYVDAYEWVMVPNVLGMGLYADGGLTATKPYIASANYIRRMSDYCQECRYQPTQRTGSEACPFNFLYWHFLMEHEAELRANPRLGPAVLGLSRLSEGDRAAVQEDALRFLEDVAPRGG